jgi:hypothetical protein
MKRSTAWNLMVIGIAVIYGFVVIYYKTGNAGVFSLLFVASLLPGQIMISIWKQKEKLFRLIGFVIHVIIILIVMLYIVLSEMDIL